MRHEEGTEMAVKKQAPVKKKMAKGTSYACEARGLVVSVDEVCGCVDYCDIICCGQPMKERKVKVKATK
jgi:hypothetical protein